MHHTLGHLHRPRPHLHGQQQFAHWIDRRPHPGARALQVQDGVVFTHFPLFDPTQDSIQLVGLQLRDVHIAEKVAREKP